MTLMPLCLPHIFYVFYAVRVVSKANSRLIVPRTSCCRFLYQVTYVRNISIRKDSWQTALQIVKIIFF
jgi:hypothetical protein